MNVLVTSEKNTIQNNPKNIQNIFHLTIILLSQFSMNSLYI